LGLSIVTRKKEPLPDYLMPFYLPKMLAHALGVAGNLACEELLSRRLSHPIVGLCKRFGVKSLPISGHTYLRVARTT